MTPDQFRSIRLRLGLTQPELARLLGYAHASTVGALESPASGKVVTAPVERLMRAYAAGYRPPEWPEREEAS